MFPSGVRQRKTNYISSIEQTAVLILGFEVVTAMVMKYSISWKYNAVQRPFGRTCCLYFQGRRTKQARSQCESRWQIAFNRYTVLYPTKQNYSIVYFFLLFFFLLPLFSLTYLRLNHCFSSLVNIELPTRLSSPISATSKPSEIRCGSWDIQTSKTDANPKGRLYELSFTYVLRGSGFQIR